MPGTGPAVADDNRGEVDVVGLITHSEGRTQSVLLGDAAALPVSSFISFFRMVLVFHLTPFKMLLLCLSAPTPHGDNCFLRFSVNEPENLQLFRRIPKPN